MADSNEIKIGRFCDYLRINTAHPNPNYQQVVQFFKHFAEILNLPFEIYYCVPNKPIIIITIEGIDKNLPSIVLNSHTDVVPVAQSEWKYDAFAAIKTEDGNIYARGTQDMKCVGMQYLEAIIEHKRNNNSFLRTIHLLYVPDEEIGGNDGMRLFVHTEKFASLNAGLVLDEGLASPTEDFTFFYGERTCWWIKIRVTGPTGHGSRFIPNAAIEKLNRTMNKIITYREEQKAHLEKCRCKLGDVTTVNITYLKAGVTSDGKNFSVNVIPCDAEAGIDMRIAPDTDINDIENLLKSWTSEEGMTYEFFQKNEKNVNTDLSEKNVYFTRFKQACDELKINIVPEIFPAGTDSRYVRLVGIPAFGFSPINNSPILLHEHNEFLNEKIYLKGIDIYYTIINWLANTPSF
eukprot:TRINITY_DN193_c0_g2_i1.p1 TRINITY_DN193_c0_g2~~TRINITY_DN193_c0_g2_i1.p1  ORF type:complete len:422 (-),score=165.46 TRINITY_DN193_c0_g2_i1:33-1247(-)